MNKLFFHNSSVPVILVFKFPVGTREWNNPIPVSGNVWLLVVSKQPAIQTGPHNRKNQTSTPLMLPPDTKGGCIRKKMLNCTFADFKYYTLN